MQNKNNILDDYNTLVVEVTERVTKYMSIVQSVIDKYFSTLKNTSCIPQHIFTICRLEDNIKNICSAQLCKEYVKVGIFKSGDSLVNTAKLCIPKDIFNRNIDISEQSVIKEICNFIDSYSQKQIDKITDDLDKSINKMKQDVVNNIEILHNRSKYALNILEDIKNKEEIKNEE
jgi:hypothetical protein